MACQTDPDGQSPSWWTVFTEACQSIRESAERAWMPAARIGALSSISVQTLSASCATNIDAASIAVVDWREKKPLRLAL